MYFNNMNFNLVTQCLIGNPCVNGDCTNKEGGYPCHCYAGYLQEEGVCLDVNEVRERLCSALLTEYW